MSRWINVQMLQSRPGDLGQDENRRIMFGFNIMIRKVPSEELEQEVATVLIGAGLGDVGVGVFVSSMGHIPVGAGPYVSIQATGGGPGIRTQEVPGIAYEQATVTVIARAETFVAASGAAWAAFNALAVVQNTAVAAAPLA